MTTASRFHPNQRVKYCLPKVASMGIPYRELDATVVKLAKNGRVVIRVDGDRRNRCVGAFALHVDVEIEDSLSAT